MFLDFKNLEILKKYLSIFPDIVVNTFVFHPVDLCEKHKNLSHNGNVKIVKISLIVK